MQRYVTWYLLQLKAWCIQKTCWLQVAAMCLILWVLMCISIPAQENRTVGVCNINGNCAEQITDILENSDSIFVFRRYGNEEEMRKDIVAGKIECGFSFTERFDTEIEHSNIRKCVKYMETPFATKGSVARETFYTAFLQVYGKQILTNSVESIYGSYDEMIIGEVLENNQEYLDSDMIFQIDQKRIQTQNGEQKELGKTYPIQGLVGLFLFGIMFMEHGREFESGKRKIRFALSAKERCFFQGLGYLAAATIAALAGGIWIICTPDSRGIGIEILRMIMYLLYGSVWTTVVGKLFRNQTSFIAWTVTFIVIQILICPVFMDVSVYIEALRYIRYLFPLGIYL